MILVNNEKATILCLFLKIYIILQFANLFKGIKITLNLEL